MDDLRNLQSADKKSAIGSMFDNIAFRYDFLNRLLSFGIDRSWRKKAIKIISGACSDPEHILDVATGTGDLAIAAMKLSPSHITGIDISVRMLEEGRDKIRKRGLSDKIDLVEGDAEKIIFKDNSFDVAMVAFGVRNFSDPLKGLSEMKRALKKDGIIMVLEFSKPSGLLFNRLYNFYFLSILPFVGKIFSKDVTAYRYLPESVMQFPDNKQFINMLKQAGFTSIEQRRLTCGVASIYTGRKS
jgi:demethylmenaquinone methyltransferase/2-methoxy-6-polyprenyl-1,4-benzoquinol methylase